MSTVQIPAAGFADPVGDAQRTFRAILDALSRPTRTVPVCAVAGAPAPLHPTAAAVLLTLCDDATPLWLDERLRDGDVAEWLRFHTGAPILDTPEHADFAVVTSPALLPRLDAFAPGSDDAPHTSATVLVQAPGAASGATFTATGPGFERPAHWRAPAFPAWFQEQWSANTARFPRGVDLLIADDGLVTGLPRTTRLTEVD